MTHRATVHDLSSTRLLRSSAMALLVWCLGCPPPSPPLDPRFVVLPMDVQVRAPDGAGAPSFRLEVRARDAAGETESAGVVTWTSSNPAVTIAPDDDEAVVTLPASMGAGDSFKVTASNGTRTGSSTIVVVGPTSAPSDEARDDVATAEPPSVVLFTGNSGGTCAYDRTGAFVGRRAIGTWMPAGAACARADAIIFSTTGPPLVAQPFMWTAGQDLVDGGGNGAPIELPLQVVIALPAADANADEAYLKTVLLQAGDAFTRSRTGIAMPPGAQTFVRAPLSPAVDWCTDIASLTGAAAPDSKKLNIYMLPSVYDPVNFDVKAQYCEPNVILLSRVFQTASTMGHELGHALGLVSPSAGHVLNMYGFASDNLMAVSFPGGFDRRERLSLGQLYRMHVDGRSWLKRDVNLSAGSFTCPCDAYSPDACPVLFVDLHPLPGTPPAPGGPCP